MKRKNSSILKWIIFIVIVSMLACTKTEAITPKYEMVVDWYSLDTSRLIKRTVWVFDYEDDKFNSAKDLWYVDCNKLEILQHLYYKKNGKKIQPSNYPKN